MTEYRPHVAASTRMPKGDPWPTAKTQPKPKFDPIAYAAALEVLG